jgi:hypothetical protein
MNRTLVGFLYTLIGLLTGTATLVVSTETALIRDILFKECNIRYLSGTFADHVHEIAIHNSAERPMDILVTERFSPNRSLSDLRFATVEPHMSSEFSFLQVLRTAASLQPNTDGLNRVLAALDPHYEPASLVVVDAALDKARDDKLLHLGSVFVLDRHIQRLTQCEGYSEQPGCKEEVELEKWERNVLNMSNLAGASWRSTTGLSLELGGKLHADDRVVLSGSLPADRTEYLSFVFDKRFASAANVNLLVGNRPATAVKTEADLDTSTTWLAIKYYPGRSILFGALSFFFVFMMRFITKQSTRHLGRHQLANAGLVAHPSRSESIWSELYNRTRLYLSGDYRQACRMWHKRADLTPYELFDHVRNRLLMDYGLQGSLFASDQQFDQRLDVYIRELAAQSELRPS